MLTVGPVGWEQKEAYPAAPKNRPQGCWDFFCTSVFWKHVFFWREREWRETGRSETVFVRAKFYRGLKNLETYCTREKDVVENYSLKVGRSVTWHVPIENNIFFFWTHEVAACENRSFFESCCLGQDIATGMAKNACGASNSSMLMLSKINHKLWSPIFFRMNICVFKRLFKHGTAGAPYFLSQKKINAAKAADVSAGFGVDGSNDDTTSMVKDGKELGNNRVVGRESFGTQEGCIQERPRKRFCVCYPFEELWSQHFRSQSTFIKEKQRVGFTSKWTSKVYTLLEDWQKMLPFLSYRGCPIILDRAVLCRDIRKACRFGLDLWLNDVECR